MSIYITGDTHGAKRFGFYSVDGFMPRFNTDSFPEQKEMTKEDFVIICGDFGGVWSFGGETKEEAHNLNWLENKPFTTLFVPGNHENYDRLTGISDESRLNSWLYGRYLKKQTDLKSMPDLKDPSGPFYRGYPQKQWHGGPVREIRPSVLMLERGYVYDIGGYRCFAFGGANSHDIRDGILDPLDFNTEKEFKAAYKKWNKEGKQFRVKGLSWWQQEVPSQQEMDFALKNLELHGNKVDYIITHDGPASAKISLGYETDAFSRFLEEIRQQVSYEEWFFGHLHDNRAVEGGKEFLLYEQIIRIG
ncbi:MAG: metallophosphoesterase family protein [Lachnospiraceae bacterium]|nr:metallophosphoesterase family protein [Lachnospiraceae bacterium]MDY4970881.1 metallophosphoesterase family protein [Lachnospiraceae bacterium]